MYGQGHYPPLFRPPYQQSQTNPPPLPPFQQAHPGPPPPPNPVNQPHSGPPPQYQHGVPPPQQPVPSYFCASSQPYMPMMSPMQGNHPMHTTYSQPNISYHPHHFSQPMPPPSIILPPPPPPPHSQGQVLYRTPAPPPPGIQHVPAPPPPPPSGFASVTPAPFTLYGQSTTGDAYPPSLPPPPPPPPPPSSPPPLPLSPPPPSSPAVEFHGILKAQSPDQPHCGNANAVVTLNDDEAGESENKDHVLKAEFLEDIPLPPPKPADEDVVRNIEAMCRFMVNVGPDFENLARTKEAGNPKFAFLFGGEPGNDAAIGHEYFQWMKMKFLSETHSPKDQEQIVTGPRALKVGDSSQSGKNDEGAAVSPSVSDMDMEDDVSHPDADIVADDLGKESASEAISLDRKIHAVTETFPAPMDDVSQPDADTVADDSDKASAGEAISLDGKIHVVHETFPAPMGTRDQLVPEVLESGTLSNTGSVQYQDDGVDGKVSPLLEDVSPVRHMPTAAKETKDNVQGFVRVPVEGSSQVNVSSAPAGCRILETPMVYVKDESPFRLIQGYASDNSEEDGERENDNEINAELTPTAAIGSDSPIDKTSKLPSSSTPDNVSPLEIGSNHQADSTQIFHSMPAKGGESLGNLPDKATSESVICPPVDPSNEVVDLQDDKLDDKIINCEPSQKNDLLDGGVLRNGRLSDLLEELQSFVNGLEKSGKQAGTDSEASDIAMQVRRLAMEVRQLASARSITVLNGSGQAGNMTSLIGPAAAIGAVGYGYMWWKGISFSDLMYVTKKNMATAVSSMTKQLDQVSAALAAAKKHLTQRLENLDGKLDEQKALSTEIKHEVSDVRGKISNIGFELESLKGLVWGLDGKMNSLEDKQNFACAGVMYLCEFVADKGKKMPEFLKDAPKPKCHYLGYNEGLKQFMETTDSSNVDRTQTEANFQSDINSISNLKGLTRTASIKCV